MTPPHTQINSPDDAPPRQRNRLTRSRIVDAALAIVRAEGLTALTMRRVAADLKAGAMSLYRHVADRDDLLVGMMDHVALGIEPPEPQSGDREEIVAIMMAFHRAFRRDPWLVHVLLFEGRGSLNVLPLFDRLFAAMTRLGCGPAECIELHSLLLHYAYGESLSYQTKDTRLAVRQNWDSAAFADFPAAMAVNAAAKDWPYDEFERNIRRIVARIIAQVSVG